MPAGLDSLPTTPESSHFPSNPKPAEPEGHIVTQSKSLQTQLSFHETQYEFLQSRYLDLVKEHGNLVKEHSKCSSLQVQLQAQINLVSRLEDGLAEQREKNVKLQENIGLLTRASEGYRARILEKAKEVDLLK